MHYVILVFSVIICKRVYRDSTFEKSHSTWRKTVKKKWGEKKKERKKKAVEWNLKFIKFIKLLIFNS